MKNNRRQDKDGKYRWYNFLLTKRQKLKRHRMLKNIGKKDELRIKYLSDYCHCGSPMILRTGKFGEFMGCSTYPRCRGTKRIIK